VAWPSVNKCMTYLENTYQTLKQAKLTTTREAFSSDYVGMSRNWFAWQRHMNRDFSLSAAIRCLRSIRAQQQRDPALNVIQLHALTQAEHQLLQHLNEQHSVADVCG
jgi:hypothetical protein